MKKIKMEIEIFTDKEYKDPEELFQYEGEESGYTYSIFNRYNILSHKVLEDDKCTSDITKHSQCTQHGVLNFKKGLSHTNLYQCDECKTYVRIPKNNPLNIQVDQNTYVKEEDILPIGTIIKNKYLLYNSIINGIPYIGYIIGNNKNMCIKTDKGIKNLCYYVASRYTRVDTYTNSNKKTLNEVLTINNSKIELVDQVKYLELYNESNNYRDAFSIIDHYSDFLNISSKDVEYFKKIHKYLNWDSLSQAKFISYFLDKIYMYIHWTSYFISHKTKIDLSVIDKYEKYIDFKQLSYYAYLLNEEIINKYKDKLDWVRISEQCPLSEKFIESNIKDINFYYISKNSKIQLSEEFMLKYKDKLFWDEICKSKLLTQNFIEKMDEYHLINWKIVYANQCLSQDFLCKHQKDFERYNR